MGLIVGFRASLRRWSVSCTLNHVTTPRRVLRPAAPPSFVAFIHQQATGVSMPPWISQSRGCDMKAVLTLALPAALLAGAVPAEAEAPCLRSDDALVKNLVTRGLDGSETFRQLFQRLEDSNLIVHLRRSTKVAPGSAYNQFITLRRLLQIRPDHAERRRSRQHGGGTARSRAAARGGAGRGADG